MDYIGHSVDGRQQLLSEHLLNTAELAGTFASAFDAGEIGKRCGILHDIGKYSDKFQRRIRNSGERVDHATAGALEAFALRDIPCAFCIAGHHFGLPDLGNHKIDNTESPTFWGKMKRRPGAGIEEYKAFKGEMQIPAASVPPQFLRDGQSAFFFIRMLYSCLVDADYLDTEAFATENAVQRGEYEDLSVLWDRLECKIEPWWNAETELNRRRCQILRAMMARSGGEKGLFTLTVPTGGGKTISSMAFAFGHAIKNGMRRIIYVIPYTNIIEQTQRMFEDIFGSNNVIAHYCNVTYETDENTLEDDRRRLATENWDAPIILTTAVQFFESLYANRSSRCRRLHNIADSVIIFDEAQMLPVPSMIPCLSAVAQLVKNYGCTAVLCTATQPSLGRLFAKLLPEYPPQELCPNMEQMCDWFRRVRYETEGRLSDEELARRLSQERQVLCIVNSRKQAQRIYAKLGYEGIYHLSTMMTPHDRRNTLDEIRHKLSGGEPCRVISTSIVEAGVDVDFPTVYRSAAGLDSILQAGGRCNREGRNPAENSVVHIFETDQKPPELLRQNIAAAEHTMRDYEDISSPDAVKSYFDFLLYTLKDEKELDRKEIMRGIEGGELPFASVAQRFHLIENTECTVYIPAGGGVELIRRLRKHGPSRSLMRELGQYAVGVYPNHFHALIETGAAEQIAEDAAVLCDLHLYSTKTGLVFDWEEGRGFMI